MAIEKVSHRPSCRNCGKALGANYETDRESFHEASGKKREYLTPEQESTMISPGPPADPDAPCSVSDYTWGMIHWEPKVKRWFRLRPVYRIREREFLGTFGYQGNNHFCTLRCGFEYACHCLDHKTNE